MESNTGSAEPQASPLATMVWALSACDDQIIFEILRNDETLRSEVVLFERDAILELLKYGGLLPAGYLGALIPISQIKCGIANPVF